MRTIMRFGPPNSVIRLLVLAVGATACVWPAVLSAHVRISPRESSPGATEKYTVRVPTEGTVATTSVDLAVPEGVVIETFAAPAGWTYTVKKDGDRIRVSAGR